MSVEGGGLHPGRPVAEHTYFAVANDTTQLHHLFTHIHITVVRGGGHGFCPDIKSEIESTCIYSGAYVVCPVPMSAVILVSKPSERIGISGV
jgi:hypothetical protein